MTTTRSKSSPAVEQLCEIEKCIEDNLSRYYRLGHGNKADSFFLHAMEELIGVLAQGLCSLESRRTQPACEVLDPTEPPPSSTSGPAEQFEFLLDYEYELECLGVLGKLDQSLLPQGLRGGRGSGRGATVTTRCAESVL